MTGLLEIREKIKLIYSKGEVFILPVVKFLLAYIVLSAVNNRMGYMAQVTNVALVLILSLMCSFLSTGCLVFFAAVFSLLHMYALSIEVALVGLCVYLILYLLYFRFGLKDSLIVVLTPLLFGWNIPYVIPLTVGLVCGPASAVSVACGVVIYYLSEAVVSNASNIKTMSEDAVGKIRLMVDSIVKNKAMLVVVAVFVLTVLVVYLLRRLSIDYAWTIAMVAGAMTLVMALLIGDLLYDINISVGATLLGTLLGLVICKIIEFFRFCVDYNRTERVQFEDDEYYYYVKAVPKMSVAMSTKTVKRINAQKAGSLREGDYASGRTAERTVVMERTGTAGPGYRNTQRTPAQRAAAQRVATRGEYRTGRSVTVGNTDSVSEVNTANSDNGAVDDYEEIF